MRKHLLFLALSFAVMGGANCQTVAKSILAEYGYANVPKEDIAMHTMFGLTKYRLYSDAKYLKIESYQDLTEEESKKNGPTLRSAFIKDRSTGEVYPCISFGDLRIRMKGAEKEQASFKEMVESFNSDSSGIYGVGSKTASIQDISCTSLLIKGKFADTITAYMSNWVVLDPSIKDFPLYLTKGNTKHGLMLGRDEILWDGKLLEFRALKLVINEPIDISSELASYELVSEKEGEKRMKAAFAKLMGDKH